MLVGPSTAHQHPLPVPFAVLTWRCALSSVRAVLSALSCPTLPSLRRLCIFTPRSATPASQPWWRWWPWPLPQKGSHGTCRVASGSSHCLTAGGSPQTWLPGAECRYCSHGCCLGLTWESADCFTFGFRLKLYHGTPRALLHPLLQDPLESKQQHAVHIAPFFAPKHALGLPDGGSGCGLCTLAAQDRPCLVLGLCVAATEEMRM